MNPIPLSPKRAEAAVRAFKGKRLLVLGDIMLDKYIWGGVSRISPEAPVPVVEVQKSTSALGGAGNVGQNLAALGASPLLVGVVGDDPEGAWIRKRLGESRGIVVDPDRPTTVKTRIIAHHQQVVRVDQERKQPFAPATEAKIAQILRREKAEGILISDYNKGVVTKSLMAAVLPRAQADGRPVFVDPKVENFALYTPVTFLSPNHHEAERIVNHPCQTEAEVERAGREIMGRLATLYLIIKRGEQGMSIFERGKTPVH
ncbi:MAG: D-glycero-beta-D-manno-heptose-7-phosphate kinase, partial [Candidatus Aminicenantes bacterium]|nr:D-glycero-beta-D-manno-heptose-7-phosphate kinase [Candidatus Aminicenantes bacterium]